MKKNKILRNYPSIIGLLLIIVLFAILSGGRTFSARNIVILFNQLTPLIIIAIGSIFLYSNGGIDMSIGAVVAFSNMIAIIVLNQTHMIGLGLLAALVTAVVCGLFSAVVTILLKLPAFIGSLCVMFIARGIVTLNTISPPSLLLEVDIDVFDQLWIKAAAILLIFVIYFILFEYTRIGRYNKAVGGNPLAAKVAGVNVGKYILFAFLLNSATIAVASFFILSKSGAVSRSTGMGMELDVIIALLLGGVVLGGGAKTRLLYAVIGSAALVFLTNGLSMLRVNILLIPFIKGAVFLVISYVGFKKRDDGLLPDKSLFS